MIGDQPPFSATLVRADKMPGGHVVRDANGQSAPTDLDEASSTLGKLSRGS